MVGSGYLFLNLVGMVGDIVLFNWLKGDVYVIDEICMVVWFNVNKILNELFYVLNVCGYVFKNFGDIDK